ncbi:hypothetical protein BH23ACT8_BH23ACT8_21280 [soil metagenome]
MRTGDLAAALGKGLVAGLVGTAAMTASSTIEARLRGREGSSAPADATAKLLGIDFLDGDSKARFSTLVHWGYGTAWGGFRGLLAGLGLSLPVGGAVHFGAVWGGELVTLPSLGVAPRWSKWGTQSRPSTRGITWCTRRRPRSRTATSTVTVSALPERD